MTTNPTIWEATRSRFSLIPHILRTLLYELPEIFVTKCTNWSNVLENAPVNISPLKYFNQSGSETFYAAIAFTSTKD